MAVYKCFHCGGKVKSGDVEIRFVCPKCNGRIFYKPRTQMKTVEAI